MDERNRTGVSTVTAFKRAHYRCRLAYHLKGHKPYWTKLSCTPHKNSAGALYSYRSVNPAKYCLQIRAFITLAGEGGDKTLLHKSTPPIQFAFHLLLCCNKLCLCCGFFQFSECFFPFFCNSSYRHNCGLLQPLSPKVSCLLS